MKERRSGEDGGDVSGGGDPRRKSPSSTPAQSSQFESEAANDAGDADGADAAAPSQSMATSETPTTSGTTTSLSESLAQSTAACLFSSSGGQQRRGKRQRQHRSPGQPEQPVETEKIEPKFSLGTVVSVRDRTWPGRNDPGGVAKITGVHSRSNSSSALLSSAREEGGDDDDDEEDECPFSYDVKYVLESRRERGVEERYMELHGEYVSPEKTVGLRSSPRQQPAAAAGQQRQQQKPTTASTASSTAAAKETAEETAAPTQILTKGDDDGPKKLTLSTSALSLALTATPLHTPREDEAIEAEVFGTSVVDASSDATGTSQNDGGGAAAKAEDGRKRRLSVQEDILFGSRNSSANSLLLAASSGEVEGKVARGKASADGDEDSIPDTKRMKIEESIEESGADGKAVAGKVEGGPEAQMKKVEESTTMPAVTRRMKNKEDVATSIAESGEVEMASAEKANSNDSEGMPDAKRMKIEEPVVKSSADNNSIAGDNKGGSSGAKGKKAEDSTIIVTRGMKMEEDVAACIAELTHELIDEKNPSNAKEEEEKKEGEEEGPISTFESYHKPAPWSSRQNLSLRRNHPPSASNYDTPNHPRWRSHKLAEDYVSLASAITLPPTHLGPFGHSPATGRYPIEQVTALGYLTSPLRRPSVVEKWNPYEISTFEAALALHGKQFHRVQRWVKTKTTKEIVEFYYVWKKTSHGRRWKGSYVDEIAESDNDRNQKCKCMHRWGLGGH